MKKCKIDSDKYHMKVCKSELRNLVCIYIVVLDMPLFLANLNKHSHLANCKKNVKSKFR